MKKKSMRIIIPLFIIMAIVAFFLIYHISSRKEAPAIHVTGIIDGTEVNLAPKVAGRISWICCSEGDTVGENQIVIRLESDDIKASVAQASAGVELAKADIKTAEASIENSRANICSADADMKSAAADVEKARAQMEESKREADRAEELFANGFLSTESRDQAVTSYEANTASYNSSREKLNAAGSKKDAAVSQLNVAVSQLNSSKAMLGQAEANLSFYRSKLDDTVIKTPVTGTVIFKALEKGETVSPGVTILTVVDLSSLYARVDIDETKIGRVVLNGPALVTVEGLPGKIFKGSISEIGRYAEFATQRDVVRGREDIKTFRVKVMIKDAQGILKPGMTVDVEIPGKT
jgi:multidrug resistance efflux pump